MTDALITDQEIAILCDVLEGWGANLNVDKRKILDQLIAKGFVVPADQEVACKIQTNWQSSTTSRRARRWTKRRLTDLGSAQKLRQLGEVHRHAAGLVAGQQASCEALGKILKEPQARRGGATLGSKAGVGNAGRRRTASAKAGARHRPTCHCALRSRLQSRAWRQCSARVVIVDERAKSVDAGGSDSP